MCDLVVYSRILAGTLLVVEWVEAKDRGWQRTVWLGRAVAVEFAWEREKLGYWGGRPFFLPACCQVLLAAPALRRHKSAPVAGEI